MAYETYYRITYDNELTERVEILLQKKDGVFGTVIQDYAATSVRIVRNTTSEGKFAAIVGRELEVNFDIRAADTDYWNDFENAAYEDWKCIATIDTQYIFHGFVLPDEGAVPFQDRPYNATIKATDGLGLLKQELLQDINNVNFRGEFPIINYIAGALKKTGLDLQIRVYDNFYHTTFLTRSDNLKWDFVSQAYLDYRTFQKDAVTFISPYDALKAICERSFKLFYQEGQWFLVRLGLYQFNAANNFYTVYAHDLTSAVGFEETGTYGSVGKHELIYPRDEDQIKTVKFAYKTVKTVFNYQVWPELPKNNKFERGALILLLSGPNYRAVTIDDWEYGIAKVGVSPYVFPYTLTATANSRAYSLRTFDAFNTEISRELIMTREPANQTETWLRSEAIPVNKFDRISISFQQRFTTNFAGSGSGAAVFTNGAIVYLVSGGTVYSLENNNGDRIINWAQSTNLGFLVVDYYGDTRKYISVDVESPPIPADGNLYIVFPLYSGGLAAGTQTIRTGINIGYHPYVAGGYFQVKGDYWSRTQNAKYPDSSEEEIFLSDNIHKVFKGCLLRSTGVPLSPTWFRYAVSESRHYKELINIAEYNHYYRRFWEIEGTFNGTKYSPFNDQVNTAPISLHKTYKLSDLPTDERFFMMLTPLDQDIIEGKFTATFAEVNKVPAGTVPIVETMTSLLNRIVAAINSTTELQWDSAAGAPPSGTAGFPPIAAVTAYAPNSISVSIGSAENMTAAVNVNGAGNSPSITETYNDIVAPGFRLINWELGTDIAIDNIFTFSAYGHDVDITVQGSTVMASADGNQLGDSSNFNYIF